MKNKELIAQLIKVLQPYRGQLLLAMIGMVIVGSFNALQAYMVKPLLDEISFNAMPVCFISCPWRYWPCFW
jgi:subfamily B ATP-binding cassette protein MsbA